ncbi:MAG: peptidase [Candidatus Acidoferrum typicum]|nr:peptidase [Candidatus Acidoferrum typicum]
MKVLHARRFPFFRMILTAVLFALAATGASATIRYAVSVEHPERHIFHVSMEVPDVTGEVIVQMPAWNALYQIRDFSAHVREVDAFAGSNQAAIEKLDKLTWRITGNGTITVRYETYWDEPGPFATQLNAEHAFINPAMILMYVPARRAEEAEIAMSDVPLEWQAAGASSHILESMGRARKLTFTAPSYDALVDAPIEAAKFDEFELRGMNPRVSVVVHGDKWNRKEVEDEFRRICTYELKLMEGAPYEHYTFLVHLGEGAGGGMEHANSTAISVRSEEQLPNIAAHEFFHLWNVKRIRPATLEPVNYTKEQYTRALWFAEGVTSTYAAYTLVRTQLWSKDQFYFDLSQQVSELENRPASRWQSAEESSLDAWLEKYPLYNRPQESVSYYAKGQVLGVLLDLLIRDRTNNERSLDDVLRAMNNEFAKQNKPYRDSLDVRLTAEQVAGGSFEDFFNKYVAHAEALPYSQILSLAGLDLRKAQHKRPVLGFFTERGASGEVIVRNVDPESTAAQVGLRSGDVVLSWNGSEAPRNPERWVYSQKAGNEVHLRVRRDEREIAIDFRIGEATETFYQVVEDSHANAKAKRIREGILHGTTQPVTASAEAR